MGIILFIVTAGIVLICVGLGIQIRILKRKIRNLHLYITEVETDGNIQFEKLADDIDRIREETK